MNVLITGGAGFIGSHLADHLIAHGYHVRALDCLHPQVHPTSERPAYLHPAVELIVGDVTDPIAVDRALDDVDAVFHFAARVGVGQSMYELAAYTETNELGTAVLLEQVVRRPIARLVVASSMSIYGEGLYRSSTGASVANVERTETHLRGGRWDPMDGDGTPLVPVPTPETKPPRLASPYALSKFAQERLALIVGQAYGIPTVALRFFNVYGSRQALSNPYTGVLAIFASRLLNDQPPLVFEDGEQLRDFVCVHDVVEACRLALDRPASEVAGQVLNIGSGRPHSVAEVARTLAQALGKPIEPQLTGRARAGDIRHCFADIREADRVLGYQPSVSLADGIMELTEWLSAQQPEDRVAVATAELEQRGLTV